MALIDKETIRKEIERRIKIYGDSHAGDATQYDSRKVRALVGLLEFLDSIPEQPMEGLEEAAKRHSCYDEDCEGAFYEPIVRNAFIAGAEWGAEHLKR